MVHTWNKLPKEMVIFLPFDSSIARLDIKHEIGITPSDLEITWKKQWSFMIKSCAEAVEQYLSILDFTCLQEDQNAISCHK